MRRCAPTPYFDSNGQPAILSGQPYRMDFGRTDLFARFDQMVWRPDADSQRGLTLFGVALFHASGDTELGSLAGVRRAGTGHPAGVATSTRSVLRSTRNAIRGSSSTIFSPPARPSAPSPASRASKVTFELNYGWQVSPAIRLMPNLQYVLNPDQSAEPFRTTNIPDAFVIGCKLAVDVSALETFTAKK